MPLFPGPSSAVLQALVNTGWLVGSQVALAGLSAFVSIQMARQLGPSDLGALNAATGLVLLMLPFIDLGLRSLLTRALVRQEPSALSFLTTAFVVQCCAALAVALPTVLAAGWLFPADTGIPHLVWILIWLLPIECLGVLVPWFDARVEGQYVAMGEIAGAAVLTTIRLIALAIFAPLWVFAAAMIAGGLIRGLIWLKVFTAQHGEVTRSLLPSSAIKAVAADAWPFLLSGACLMISTKLDVVFLAAMRDPKEAGWYSVGVLLFDMLLLIPAMFIRSVTPALVNLHQLNPELYLKRLQLIYDVMTWSAIVTAGLIWLYGGLLIQTLFGDKFIETGHAIAILALAFAVQVQGVMTSPWILAENRQKAALPGGILRAFVSVALNLVLIPHYGFIGAAWAAAISVTFEVLWGRMIIPGMRPCVRLQMLAFLAPMRCLRAR